MNYITEVGKDTFVGTAFKQTYEVATRKPSITKLYTGKELVDRIRTFETVLHAASGKDVSISGFVEMYQKRNPDLMISLNKLSDLETLAAVPSKRLSKKGRANAINLTLRSEDYTLTINEGTYMPSHSLVTLAQAESGVAIGTASAFAPLTMFALVPAGAYLMIDALRRSHKTGQKSGISVEFSCYAELDFKNALKYDAACTALQKMKLAKPKKTIETLKKEIARIDAINPIDLQLERKKKQMKQVAKNKGKISEIFK